MDKSKTTSTVVMVILNCICAAVWSIHVLIDFSYGYVSALHIVFALVWDFCAFMWIYRYIKSKKKI